MGVESQYLAPEGCQQTAKHRCSHLEKDIILASCKNSTSQSQAVQPSNVLAEERQPEILNVSQAARHLESPSSHPKTPEMILNPSIYLTSSVKESITPISDQEPLVQRKILSVRAIANMDLRGDEEELNPTPRKPIRREHLSPEVSNDFMSLSC